MRDQFQYVCYLTQEPVRKETLYLNTFGDNKCKRQNCEVYKFNIESRNGSEEIELSGLELADFDDDDNDNTIDILIGIDHYWDVVTGDVVKGESGPTAGRSKLGLLLSGRVPKSVESQDPTVSNLILAGESCDTSTRFVEVVLGNRVHRDQRLSAWTQ